MSTLRPYQRHAVNELWLRVSYPCLGYGKVNPCLVMPTGAGKSHIIAAFAAVWLRFRKSRVLMATHRKELVDQNAEKLRAADPDLPLTICSAGLGSQDLTGRAVFAGIQSGYSRASELQDVGLVIIDEAHMVSPDEDTMYRRLLSDLGGATMVVGLTATPYRLGQGLLTDGDNPLFNELLETVTIKELVQQGYLAPLRSKVTQQTFDVSGVRKSGGDYARSALEECINASTQKSRISR